MAASDYVKAKYANYLRPDPAVSAAPLDFRNLGEFQKGWEAFKDETVGIGGGALALGAQQLQKLLPAAATPALNRVVQSGLDTYQRKTAESVAGQQAPAVERIEDIKGIGDLGDWVAYQTGKGLPQLAGFGAGGVIGRQAAKLGVRRGLTNVLKAEVGDNLVGRKVTKEVKDAATEELRKILARGTVAGGLATAAPYEAGAAFGQMTGEGISPADAANEALAVGGINGLLEFLPIYEVAKKVGLGDFAKQGIRETMKKGELGKAVVELARRASTAGAVGAAAEGVTEGLQELTNIAATRWAKEQDLFANLSADEWSAVANAAAAGGLLGGGVAGAGGVFIGPQGAEAETTGSGSATNAPAGTGSGPRPGDRPAAPAAPVAPADERRANAAVRERVAAMPAEEQTAAIDYLRGKEKLSADTGVGNRLSWEARAPKPAMAAVDLDSLGWVNENLGREKGDELIAATAKALQQATGDAYHFSGDEFWVQADTEAELQTKLAAAQDALQQTEVEGYSPSFSFGIGQDTESARQAMLSNKSMREKAGLRTGRGQEPLQGRPTTEVGPTIPATPAPSKPTPAVAPAPVARPNTEEGLAQGWKPDDVKAYVTRYGDVYAGSDPLVDDAGGDKRQAANFTLPEQVARANPEYARELAERIRSHPANFAAWSGLHPDFANKVANDLEKAAAKAEETGDIVAPPAELESNFGEVSTNKRGETFTSRQAAANSAARLGLSNIAIDEVKGPAGSTFVIRSLGPRPDVAPADTTAEPAPEVIGDVQMPVNLVAAGRVPPSATITLSRQQGRRTLTKQVNARRAVILSKKRVDSLVKVIRCLST